MFSSPAMKKYPVRQELNLGGLPDLATFMAPADRTRFSIFASLLIHTLVILGLGVDQAVAPPIGPSRFNKGGLPPNVVLNSPTCGESHYAWKKVCGAIFRPGGRRT